MKLKMVQLEQRVFVVTNEVQNAFSFWSNYFDEAREHKIFETFLFNSFVMCCNWNPKVFHPYNIMLLLTNSLNFVD